MQQMPGFGGSHIADYYANNDAMKSAMLRYLNTKDVSGASWVGAQSGSSSPSVSTSTTNFYNNYQTPVTVNNPAVQQPQIPQMPQQQPQQQPAPAQQQAQQPKKEMDKVWDPQTGQWKEIEKGSWNLGGGAIGAGVNQGSGGSLGGGTAWDTFNKNRPGF